jgi:O-acetyl-ADP-ribose deacetylase (regulator of RNase III)
MEIKKNNCRIELIKGDITEMDTDAIVNAANEQMTHGGGVAAAIARRGGPDIQKESDAWVAKHGRVETGAAAITGGGRLKARYVIHAVGPVMGSGDEDKKLRSATKAALGIAESHQLSSITFPAISTGIFGYPVDRCAHVMLSTVFEYLEKETGIQHVIFCLFDDKSLDTFEREMNAITSR